MSYLISCNDCKYKEVKYESLTKKDVICPKCSSFNTKTNRLNEKAWFSKTNPTTNNIAKMSVALMSLIIMFFTISTLQNIDSSLNSNGNLYYCNWCGDNYNGRGFTTAMYVVNQVDDESSPLNSYCSRKCAIDWIRSKGREPLKVN